MKRLLLIALALAAMGVWLVVPAGAQTQGAFTCYWLHNGLNTDSYAIVIDGVSSAAVATCAGTGETRTCTAPITLALNATHTLTVKAIGLMGESASLPFTIGPPEAPSGAGVRK